MIVPLGGPERQPGDEAPAVGQAVSAAPRPQPWVDAREALYNDCRVGTAGQVQLPREAVTRLHGLAVDLDADLLQPNPWFPPGPTSTAFAAAIAPALARHPVLCHAEVRDTGRWVHAITWFEVPVELRTAADQRRWTALHKVLMGSVPSDPAAPALIALTRPAGSTNSKTGAEVRTLKPGAPVPAAALEGWAAEVARKPFEAVGTPLFGGGRVSPCPYCRREGSHLDLGAAFGLCYGACRHVPFRRLFEPFFKGLAAQEAAAPAAPQKPAGGRKRKPDGGNAGEAPQVITINGDTVLEIDPATVQRITITVRVKDGEGER
jgi:hypothetical protein